MSKQNFTKIAEWKKQPEEYQNVVFCVDKLWFFGKKFLEQPTYHWGHHVVFGGTSSDWFDIRTGEWSQKGPVLFPQIAAQEHFDELLFVYNSHIFLLLYSHFGQFYPHSLHQFDSEGQRQWLKLVDFPDANQAVPTEKSYKNSLILVDGPGQNGLYFVSFAEHKIGIHLLELASGKSPNWVNFCAQIPEEVELSMLQPTQAAHSNGIIFIQGGIHGCGFRWQPNKLIKFKLADKSAQMIEIEGANANWPSFTYLGPIAHSILSNKNVWLHIAGHNASGMTGTTFNGEIWALENLDAEDGPKWEKLSLEVPKLNAEHASNLNILHVKESGQLFLTHEELGILVAKLSI